MDVAKIIYRLIPKKIAMEEIYKREYKALKYYASNTRVDIEKEKQDGICKISKEIENRMIKQGFIDFTVGSNGLYRDDFVLTESGAKGFLELREIWRKDWSLYIAVGAMIISLLAILFVRQSYIEILKIIMNATI